MTTIVTIGIDLAKNVFAVHGVDATGPPCQTICRAPKLWTTHTEATPHEKKPPLQRV